MKFIQSCILLAATTTSARVPISMAFTSAATTDDETDAPPNACVSINVHHDTKCSKEPFDTLTFSTYTEAGKSGCHDDEHGGPVAYRDQYCDLQTGNFHQVVYPKGSQCIDKNIPWYQRIIFPQTQVFTPDNCLAGGPGMGLSLNYCKAGPCDDVDHHEASSTSSTSASSSTWSSKDTTNLEEEEEAFESYPESSDIIDLQQLI